LRFKITGADRITLEFLTKQTAEPVSLTLVSMHGTTVIRDAFKWQKIRTFTLANLTPGIYIVRITSGDRSGNLKILIQ
jgi:hypothetical protein